MNQWVVMRVQPFTLETQSVLGTRIVFDSGKMVGYLPVYETREDALADFPDGPVYEAVSEGSEK